MRRRLLNALLFLPATLPGPPPPPPGLPGRHVEIRTSDGERLSAWWVRSPAPPLAHILYCHGNGGNLVDRTTAVAHLARAGFDVLLFDYRGYGASTGRPSEAGTYDDARAARRALLGQAGVDASRLLYLGESLGGAVAVALARRAPPAGVVLQSAFASVREVARVHYPFIPSAVVPDAYPSVRSIRGLRAPLLVLHGARDAIVPASHGEALYAAAPEPKRLCLFPEAGHGDLVARFAARWTEAIVGWAREVLPPRR